MLTRKFKATIKDSKLAFGPLTLKLFREHLATLEGKEAEVAVRKWKKTRSGQQNKLYWKWIHLIAECIGEDDPEAVHTGFKSLFLIDRAKKPPVIRSTAKLTTLEFGEYMAKVRRYSEIELNIKLPTPDDLWGEWE